MANGEVNEWVKQALPMTGSCLEVGSFNVNGTLRTILPVTHGIDIRLGKCVDEVLDACDLLKVYGPESWDNVVSASTFEHVEFWEPALRNAWGVLKTGGKFVFEVPTAQKGYHAHPFDFWRWDLPILQETFKDQDIIALSATWRHGVGCICRKVTELTYAQPHEVAGKPREKKKK